MSTRLLLALAVLLAACAKIVPPDGGDRDTTPPQVLSIEPPDGTVNFAAAEIVFTFDEYVQLSDLNSQLIVSPPLNERPTTRLKGKQLILSFNEELLPNVTYTLNFGEGVKDYTEGNPAALSYVFSTGSFLDSLTFTGSVTDAFTGAPVKGARVMLYRDTAAVAPLEQKPYYFARTDEAGNYRLNYLSEGVYRLVALEETNMNYLYDDPAERFAYADSLVVPAAPSDSLVWPVMRMSQAVDTNLYAKSFASDSSGYIRIQLNRPDPDRELSLAALDSSLAMTTWFELPDSLFGWMDAPAESLINIRVASPTSVDTFEVESYRVAPRSLGVRSKPASQVRAGDTLEIRFARPLARVDTSLMQLMRDSTVMELRVETGKNPFGVLLFASVEDEKKYSLTLFPGAVTSVEGFTNDTLKLQFSTFASDHFGNLKLKIGEPALEGNALMQLYQEGKNEGGSVREWVAEPGAVIELKRLMPGSYKLRMIDDRNRNGRFDPVDYRSGKQPERVYNLQGEINVRSNWDLDLEWDFD